MEKFPEYPDKFVMLNQGRKRYCNPEICNLFSKFCYEVQCIGATTLDEYRESIEDDGALTRRFQEVFISAPSVDDTINILSKIKFLHTLYLVFFS